MIKRFMTAAPVMAFFAIAVNLTALASVSLKAVDATAAPGQTAKVSLLVSGAVKLTAGQFRVSVVGSPSVTISAVKAGQAALDAGSCAGCTSENSSDLLTTGTGSTSATSVFLFSSGCAEGFLQNGECAAGHETGGITGDNQELAQVWIDVPANASAGTTYSITLGNDPDLSDAGSNIVSGTVINGTLNVLNLGGITLLPGGTTTYHGSTALSPSPDNLMVPTSGDDPNTPAAEPLFPDDNRALGNRRYFFTVNATGLNGSHLSWSVQAQNVPGLAPYTPDQLSALAGTVAPANADGTLGAYTPANLTMSMPRAINLLITAKSEADPNQSVVFNATMFPYGDTNLDGKVSQVDFLRAFRWASGLALPEVPQSTITGVVVDPTQLQGYVGPTVQRLLSDVRPVGPLSPTEVSGFNGAFDQWVGEFVRIGAVPPVKSDFDRATFPFGNGRVTQVDFIWIFRKAVFIQGDPPATLDPEVGSTLPVPGF